MTGMKKRLLSSLVRIVEVGPRDGLQNERKMLSVADKLKFIQLLGESGLGSIEVGSFVAPDRVPQVNKKGAKGRLKMTRPGRWPIQLT